MQWPGRKFRTGEIVSSAGRGNELSNATVIVSRTSLSSTTSRRREGLWPAGDSKRSVRMTSSHSRVARAWDSSRACYMRSRQEVLETF